MGIETAVAIIIAIVVNSPKIYGAGKQIFAILTETVAKDEELTPEKKDELIKRIQDAQASIPEWK